MNVLQRYIQKPGGLTRLVFLALCLIALGFIYPSLKNEIRASTARNALENFALADVEKRAELLSTAARALTPYGPTGELYDLAAQLELLETPLEANAAKALTWRALGQSPNRAESWARLAYIELLSEGKLTDEAVTYLDHSFVVEPAGYKQFMVWRLNFAFTHWQALPAGLQKTVLRSLRMAAEWRGDDFALELVENSKNLDLLAQAQDVLQVNAGR